MTAPRSRSGTGAWAVTAGARGHRHARRTRTGCSSARQVRPDGPATRPSASTRARARASWATGRRSDSAPNLKLCRSLNRVPPACWVRPRCWVWWVSANTHWAQQSKENICTIIFASPGQARGSGGSQSRSGHRRKPRCRAGDFRASIREHCRGTLRSQTSPHRRSFEEGSYPPQAASRR